MLALSRHLSRGRFAPRDEAQAAEWAAAAAEAGLPEAQAELGRRLLRGDGVAADAKAAVRWLEKCAEAGAVSSPVCSWARTGQG